MVLINPLMLVVTKGHMHTETDLQTNLLLPQGVKELKGALGTFKEQSRNIRSIPLVVFLEKVALKNFRKIPRKPSLTEHMLKVHNYAKYKLCH